jgi:hypothetical protein
MSQGGNGAGCAVPDLNICPTGTYWNIPSGRAASVTGEKLPQDMGHGPERIGHVSHDSNGPRICSLPEREVLEIYASQDGWAGTEANLG